MLHRPHSPSLRLLLFALLIPPALVIGLHLVARAAGTISLTSFGTAYTQDFDTLANNTAITNTVVPEGWAFFETGAGANQGYRAGNGSINTGDTYSFGATGSTERAFGGLLSSSLNPTIGAQFTNDTGGTIRSLAIAYTGEQWRFGAVNRGAADRLDFQYSTDATSLSSGTWTDVDALDFAGPVITGTARALDGNLEANRTTVAGTIGGLNIAGGATFWIRWTDFNASGSDDGLAVDDFSLVPSAEGAPTVIATDPADGAIIVPVDTNVVITFSEPVTVTGQWFTLTCAKTGAHTAAVSGGPTTFTLDPDTDLDPAEVCTVAVVAAQVTDQDSIDPPDAMAADYVFSFDTTDPCTAPYTTINAAQGSGPSSPLDGTPGVTVQGIVVGDFQGDSALNGFYLQSKPADVDADPLTSEGIFVFVPVANPFSSVDVVVGDEVRVTGRVVEFNTLTEIDNLTDLRICGTTTPPAAAVVELPEATNNALERYEGMLITIPEPLTVAQNFFQGQYGQVTLASGGRLLQPTNAFVPGTQEAVALAHENARRLLVLDDGRSSTNPNPTPYIGTDNTLRAGDTVLNLTGVLEYGPINSGSPAIRDYRLHPTEPLFFARVNARTAAPDPVGGRLKVASFNVLNYFTTIDQSGGACFPSGTRSDCRGADSAAEFDLQSAKIVQALVAMDADVVGLIEIENNGSIAMSDLVDRLNAAKAPGAYAIVADPGTQAQLGGDAIKVGLIYQPGRVTPVGPSLLSTDPIFDRAPVAQIFVEKATGAHFSVVVNHFKSKSSCPDDIGSPESDQGDGQGCWNPKRVQQAQALLTFIGDIQTAGGDPDVLIVGDLNAYQFEDPILALENGGLVNLLKQRVPGAYTYTFDGLIGALDHALATPSAAGQVSGATVWHVNTDEPAALDYNNYNNVSLQTISPYRSSDHDPVLIGMGLTTVPLTVTRTGTGAGHVSSDPAGIDCGANCTIDLAPGSVITLTATADPGSTFAGWTGAGCGSDATCVITLTAATEVTATFTLNQYALVVEKAGTGGGTVASTPAGIACGADCNETFGYNTVVTLTATVDPGSTFAGWTGAGCSTGACVVTMDAAKTVTATFALNQYALTVQVEGQGTVTSTPAGITCGAGGADCTESLSHGSVITLTAAEAEGYSFTGWSEATCAAASSCAVEMGAARTVTATFTLNQYALTVHRVGNGAVSSTPAGIACGADCSEVFDHGMAVTLTATADPDSTFSGWTGAGCSTGACVVTMDAAKTVTATFALNQYALTVQVEGQGTVTSTPAGITCGAGGADCTESLGHGSVITLTATPATGHAFDQWSGACSGAGPCVVPMTETRSVTATFAPILQSTHALTVVRVGNGAVSSTPAGIACGADCSEVFEQGTVVTLTATADTGSTFAGWTGAGCSTGACIVTMDAARTVTATFALLTHPVTTTAGSGGAIGVEVLSGPPPVNGQYAHGTRLRLTATPEPDFAFAGWEGDADGNTNPLEITVEGPLAVRATFVRVDFWIYLPRIDKE